MAEIEAGAVNVVNDLAILFESSNSSDSDDDEVALAQILLHRRHRNLRGPLQRVPHVENFVTDVVRLWEDEKFRENFRMRRDTFHIILNRFQLDLERDGLVGRERIPAEVQLLVALWSFSTPDSYRSISLKFGISKSSAWECVMRVSAVIYRHVDEFIKWPTLEEAQANWNISRERYGLSGVTGSLDGTQIKITAPLGPHSQDWVNRNSVHAIQLQVVCDVSLKFIHCFTGMPGSVHDMRVFSLSGLQERCTPDYFPNGSFLLADSAYAIQENIIVPYRDNGQLGPNEVLFNTTMSSCRMMVERAIGMLKGRFRTLLDTLPMRRADLLPRCVILCCIIHNMCIDNNDFAEVVEEALPPDQPVPRFAVGQQERLRGREKRLRLTEELAAGGH